jgi:hypothetical protein
MAWYYIGQGQSVAPHANEFSVITSTYRWPLVVMDMALDPVGRGVYETKQYPLGLAVKGYSQSPNYRLRTDAGGIYRYSYCTPDFILGTTMFESRPLEDWTRISSQNRWQGVVFAGHPDARIVPQCRPNIGNHTCAYNPHWSVQSRGTLITQKLRTHEGAGEMRVWFSKPGLTHRTEKDGWVFAETEGAFAAVRPVAGGYVWQSDPEYKGGKWLKCNQEWTPVILEVAQRSRFADYAAFQACVIANPLTFANQILEYKSVYGDAITFFADYSHSPKINGRTVSYAPKRAFDSPFVQGEWDGGVVTIRNGNRQLVLNFNKDQ